jgi:anti-sigma factor RsiW
LSLDREVHRAHKKMTKFLCMELMYEYVSGTLDPRREQDIETYLPTDRECQRELERVKRAIAYTHKAAHASVTPALHEALLKFEPQWQKSLREWTLWSSQRGWRALPYVFDRSHFGGANQS